MIADCAGLTWAGGLFGSQVRAQLPDFPKPHHVQHLAQVADAAGAAFEVDDTFGDREVPNLPNALFIGSAQRSVVEDFASESTRF